MNEDVYICYLWDISVLRICIYHIYIYVYIYIWYYKYIFLCISNSLLYSINPSSSFRPGSSSDLKKQDAGPDLEKLKAAEDCHVNRKWKPGEPTVDGSKVPNNHRLDV